MAYVIKNKLVYLKEIDYQLPRRANSRGTGMVVPGNCPDLLESFLLHHCAYIACYRIQSTHYLIFRAEKIVKCLSKKHYNSVKVMFEA